MRILLVFFSSLVFLSFYAKNISAQMVAETASPSAVTQVEPIVFDSTQALKDYQFIIEEYTRARSAYLLARSQYLQAQTLAAQSQARVATSEFITKRDEVVRAFLLFIRTKLTEDQQLDSAIRDGLTTRIDSEIAWWESHKGRIRSAGSLNDLVTDSDEASKRYLSTEKLIYEAKSSLALSKVLNRRNEVSGLLANSRTVVSNISQAGNHPVSNAQRWIIEAENKVTRSFDKDLEASKVLVTLQSATNSSTRDNPSASYTNLINLSEESLQFLREASSHIKEVIKSLKFKI